MSTGNHDISLEDLHTISRAVGPTIREDLRHDLDNQTKEFKGIVKEHEMVDKVEFSEVKASVADVRTSVQAIQVKQAKWGGAIGILVILVPIIIELVKWKTKG